MRAFYRPTIVILSGMLLGVPHDAAARLATPPDAEAFDFGGQTFRIGMSQDRVLALLSPRYSVKPVADSDGRATIMATNDDEFNTLTFCNGALCAVSTQWGPRQDSGGGVAFAEALYGAVAASTHSAPAHCTVEIGIKNEPRHEWKNVFIVCGSKTVSIGILHSPGASIQRQATVSWHIGRTLVPGNVFTQW